MDFLTNLWLPILLSGVAVWFASALAWMAIGHHKRDRDPIPGGESGEREFMDVLRRMNLSAGTYGFPDFCRHDALPRAERMQAMKALYDTRPMGILRVWGEMNMGVNMLLTFAFYLVTSAVIASLAWAALAPLGPGAGSGAMLAAGGAEPSFGRVFQITATAGVLAYCFASFPNDLWFQNKRRAMVMNWIDGAVFGLITGAIFAWLWPR